MYRVSYIHAFFRQISLDPFYKSALSGERAELSRVLFREGRLMNINLRANKIVRGRHKSSLRYVNLPNAQGAREKCILNKVTVRPQVKFLFTFELRWRVSAKLRIAFLYPYNELTKGARGNKFATI